MKNKLLAVAATLGAVLLALVGYQVVQARFSEIAFDQVVVQLEAEDNVVTNVRLNELGEATSTVLADLSDTAHFPHYKNTGDIHVSQIKGSIYVNQGGAATTTLKFGVVASTTPDGELADIKYFDSVSFYSGDGLVKDFVLDYSPSLMKLGVDSLATTTSYLSNDEDLLSSDWATSSPLTGPRGTYTSAPGVGDLVMRVDQMAGTATVTAQTFYHVK